MFGAKFLRLILPFLLCAPPPAVSGQRNPAQGSDGLPRVGMIDREEPRGTSFPGCDSHPLSFRKGAGHAHD